MPLYTVRVSHDHHFSGPWSLKDRTDVVGIPGARSQTVSTRILGIGIALVGVLALAIGLIMGLEFPNYVQEQTKQRQCVVHEGHGQFQSWSQGSQWSRRVYVYYWTLINEHDFLYNGQAPKFAQKGPYVYTETEMKYNVSFAATEVSFRGRRHHVFDSEGTEIVCSTCQEHDQVTIISPWYVRAIGQYGGEEALSWTYIPTYTATHLRAAGFIGRQQSTFNQNISVLGHFTSDTSQLSPTLTNISIGAWLRSSTRSYMSTINDEREEQDLTLSELTSFYRVLTNLSLLGGEALSRSNKTLQQRCLQWAQSLCSPVPSRLKLTLGVLQCGVVYIFRKCQSNFTSEVQSILRQTFCPPSNMNACFNLTGISDGLLLAYGNAMADFLWHLSAIVLDSFMSSRDLTLVISRNQKQLTLGYEVKGNEVFQGSHVTGLLDFNWLGDPVDASSQWKVYTCLERRSMGNNMKIKEFNNSWCSPFGLQRGVYKVSVSSYTDYVTSCPLVTCRPCLAPGPMLNFFIEDLMRAAQFVFNSSSSIDGVKVFRYELHPNTFSRSSTLRVDGGFQDMTEVVGYLTWASLPYTISGGLGRPVLDKSSAPTSSYLSGETGTLLVNPMKAAVTWFPLSKRAINTPTPTASLALGDYGENQDSEVLIEPVTGRVWEKTIKLQWNLGLSNESGHMLGRNIIATGLPLPVFWTDKVATIVNDEVVAYKHLVTRLMAVSCGGVVGFSVLAFIIFIIGVVICVYPAKPNRVLPSADDSNSTSNGRYC